MICKLNAYQNVYLYVV